MTKNISAMQYDTNNNKKCRIDHITCVSFDTCKINGEFNIYELSQQIGGKEKHHKSAHCF